MNQASAPLLVLQHSPWHGPGYFQELLQRHEIPFRIHRVTAKEPLPGGGESIAGLVVLGGPFDVHDADQQPWMQRELELIRRAIDARLPLFGHSFGAHLIATALDCQVVRSKVKQIGWFDIKPVHSGGAATAWLEGIPDWLEMFKWHQQSFDIPAAATRLFKSEWDVNEAFVLDNILAFQGHLEVTAAIIDKWLAEYAPEVSHPREDPHEYPGLDINWQEIVQGPEAICSNLHNRLAHLHQAADLIYARWLALLHDAPIFKING